MVQGGGFEPPKLARQIYSLIPLATREPLRREARFSTPHNPMSTRLFLFFIELQLTNELENGAGERSRTPDRLITSQLLYQLSYASSNPLKNNHLIVALNWRRDSRETFMKTQHPSNNFVFVVVNLSDQVLITMPNRLIFQHLVEKASPRSQYQSSGLHEYRPTTPVT